MVPKVSYYAYEINRKADDFSNNNPGIRVNSFLKAVLAYILVLAVVELSKNDVIKYAGSVFALCIFVFILFQLVKKVNSRTKFPLPLCALLIFYYFGLIGSGINSAELINFSDYLKLMIAPIFIYYGYCISPPIKPMALSKLNTSFFIAFISIPIVVFLVQFVSGEVQLGNPVSIFANGNNAGLYWLALMALYNSVTGRPIHEFKYYLPISFLFGTLGLSAAVLVALLIAVGVARDFIALAVTFIFLSFLVMIFPEWGPIERIRSVFDSIELMLSGSFDIYSMSYGDLVDALGTSDLSFIFRLKHWYDLMSDFSDRPINDILFGVGVGVSPSLSFIGLLPHNDYVRILLECGILTFIGFFGLIGYILFQIGRKWSVVPLLAIALYLFSDNLINNFICMTVFFCSLGMIMRQRCAFKNK